MMRGNLIVEAGGNLTLRNVRLILDCSFVGQYGIEVKSGGALYIYYSNITAADMSLKFKFCVGDGSLFMMKNSGLYGCGHIEGGHRRGLRIDTHYSATITGNIISNGYQGIFLICSSGNVITNNTIVENLEEGICFDPGAEWEGCNDNLIYNNTITNNKVGIRIRGSRNNAVIFNIVRGNREEGITIEYSNDNVIKDNDVSENIKGIAGFELKGNLIVCNKISYNKGDGISLGNSFNNTIGNNQILGNNGTGIMMGGHENNITNNAIKENNWDGIQIIGSCDNIIAGNHFTGCKEGKEAIWLASGSSRNIIANNMITYVPNGVHLYTWEAPNKNNTIFRNVFLHSSVKIDAGSDGNIIYQNNFTESEAQDEGLNRWDYDGRGNYWSNYEGWDEDGDGIGDTPFPVGPRAVDRYPLGPTRSEITFALERASMTYGGACKIYGSIKPSKVGKVPVTLRYSKDGGATWISLASVTSDSDGSYGYVWYPDAGMYLLMASWSGDWRYRTSMSLPLTLAVDKMPTTIKCELGIDHEPWIKEFVEIKGFMDPPLEGIVVKLEYKDPMGGSEFDYVITDSKGFFMDGLQALLAGNWTVWASWVGDSNHEAARGFIEVTVKRIPTEISCSVDKESINLGESLKVWGFLKWDTDTAKKLGISFPTVVKIQLIFILEGSVKKSEWIAIDSEGKFSYEFKPGSPGAWQVMAKWDGTPEFDMAEHPRVAFKTVAPPEFPTTTVVGLAALLGAVGGGLYILWRYFAGRAEEKGLPRVRSKVPSKPTKLKPSTEFEARLQELEKLYRTGKLSEAIYRRLKEKYEREAKS